MNYMVGLSIIIPVYNEEESLPELYGELRKVLSGVGGEYEVIFVDDGSADKSYEILKGLKEKDDSVKVIRFRKNFGQSAALDAGFRHAAGSVIVSMDADLQNDPKDIPKLLKKLEEGFDLVCGWRYKRKDSLSKKIPSAVSNILRKLLTGEKIHDSGCTLRAYTRESLTDLYLYGEMHRYIPALVAWKGYRVGEVKVSHRPRKHGKTKYGAGRLLRGFLDLITVKFLLTYDSRPMHLFGIPGIVSAFLGFLISLYMAYVRLIVGEGISNRPLLMLGVLLMVLGAQFISLGLLGELVISRYLREPSKSARRMYSIKEILA
jgi:glycosyltransferase involved in cell wall biosynthesis